MDLLSSSSFYSPSVTFLFSFWEWCYNIAYLLLPDNFSFFNRVHDLLLVSRSVYDDLVLMREYDEKKYDFVVPKFFQKVDTLLDTLDAFLIYFLGGVSPRGLSDVNALHEFFSLTVTLHLQTLRLFSVHGRTLSGHSTSSGMLPYFEWAYMSEFIQKDLLSITSLIHGILFLLYQERLSSENDRISDIFVTTFPTLMSCFVTEMRSLLDKVRKMSTLFKSFLRPSSSSPKDANVVAERIVFNDDEEENEIKAFLEEINARPVHHDDDYRFDHDHHAPCPSLPPHHHFTPIPPCQNDDDADASTAGVVAPENPVGQQQHVPPRPTLLHQHHFSSTHDPTRFRRHILPQIRI